MEDIAASLYKRLEDFRMQSPSFATVCVYSIGPDIMAFDPFQCWPTCFEVG